MRKPIGFLLSVFILFSWSPLLADVPTGMQFQAYLTDAGLPLVQKKSLAAQTEVQPV